MLVSNAVSLIRHLHQRCKLTTWRHQPLHKEYWICVIILLFYNNSYVNICPPNTSLNGMHLWQPAGGTVRGVQQLLGPVVPSVYNSLVKVCFLNFYRFRLLVLEKKIGLKTRSVHLSLRYLGSVLRHVTHKDLIDWRLRTAHKEVEESRTLSK